MDRLRETVNSSNAAPWPMSMQSPVPNAAPQPTPVRSGPPSEDPRRYLPAEASAAEHWEAGCLLGSIGRYQEAALEFIEASKKDPNLTSVEFTFQGHKFRF